MKPEAIIKKLATKPQGEAIGPFSVDIAYLVTDPTFQPRTKTDKGNVARLKAAYKSGGDVPPITVAVLEDRAQHFVIVDGHHRFEAKATILAEAQRTGVASPVEISARFIKMSPEEARWRAAEFNMHHGKQMTNAEIKQGFIRFIEAGQHALEDGSYRSLREMGKVFGKDHKTISGWLRSTFPKLAAQMLDGTEDVTGSGTGRPPPVRVVHQEVDGSLSGVRSLFDELPSWARRELVGKLRQLTADFEKRLEATADFDHDQSLDDRF